MRIVYWSPQERVDIPDMVATDFLVLGEFRRTAREVFLGGEENRILRGFAVEPAAVPDATIVVKLDNGSGVYSAALGAENMGHIGYGQLMGGEDDNQSLEGNAQQVLDFAAQPAATYTVQMRFTYSDGVADNRAFWDPSTDTEFVQNVSTRHLPNFELRLSGAASGEWINLASVVWDGVSIDAADITDLRSFAMEGTTPFQQTTQTGSGGVPDFTRTATRGDLAVGLNAIYPVLRALGRQIQDLKGPDDSGNWNWWNYPFAAFNDTNSAFTSGRTKSLRTVDTVTYTCGDGTTTFGDFNGATALEDCLQHLEDLGAQRPPSVEIVLKANTTPFFAFEINTEHDFRTDDIRLTIRGHQGQTAIVDPRNLPAADYAIVGGTQSRVVFEGLSFAFGFNNNSGLVYLGDPTTPSAGGTFQASRCTFTGDTSVSAVPVISASYHLFEMDHCEVQGVVEITGNNNTQGLDPSRSGGVIRNCTFQEGGIRGLANGGGSGDSWAVQMLIQNCEFATTVVSRLGLNGVLDLIAPVAWTIRDCRIAYQGDMDGIHIRYATGKTAQHVKIDNCTISQATTGTHSVDSGTNGANGTGWGIYIAGVSGSRAGDIAITDCRYTGQNLIDAGGLFMSEPLGVNVRGCTWEFCAHDSGASSRCSAAYVTAASSDTEVNVTFSDCTVRDWATTTANRVERTRAFFLNNVADVSFVNCNVDGGSFSTPIASRVATFAALFLDGACEDIKILGCTFENWEGDTGTASRCIVADASATIEKCTINGNRFRENGNFCIDMNPASVFSSSTIVGNIFLSNFQGIDLRAGLVSGVVCSQNTIFDGAGAATEGIAWSTGTSNNSCTGNVSNQNIRGDTGVHGYNAASEDLNSVNAYV